jgi:hypothetical protein
LPSGNKLGGMVTIQLERIELGPDGIRVLALIPWRPRAAIDTDGDPVPPSGPVPAAAALPENVLPFRRAS